MTRLPVAIIAEAAVAVAAVAEVVAKPRRAAVADAADAADVKQLPLRATRALPRPLRRRRVHRHLRLRLRHPATRPQPSSPLRRCRLAPIMFRDPAGGGACSAAS